MSLYFSKQAEGDMADDRSQMNGEKHMALSLIQTSSCSISKSAVRTELIAALESLHKPACAEEIQDRTSDAPAFFLFNEAVGAGNAGLEAQVVAYIRDVTAAQGALYAPPKVKKVTGTADCYYLAEEIESVGALCKRLERSIFGHLSMHEATRVTTYCLADQSEAVMDAKGIERLKNRGEDKHVSRLDEIREELATLANQCLAQACNDRLFVKGCSKREERCAALVEWMPEGSELEEEDDERTVELRSVEELLENADDALPSPFFEVMRDRQHGRPAVTRRFVLHVANEMYLAVGHTVVFWGHSHCLKPKDFNLSEEYADLVSSMAVVIHRPDPDLLEQGLTQEDVDRMTVATCFSANVDDLLPATDGLPETVARTMAFGRRMVLVNRLVPTLEYGEADHGVIRVLRNLTDAPLLQVDAREEEDEEEEEEDSHWPAVMICASDTDVLLYAAAMVAEERLNPGCRIPRNIYFDISRPNINNNPNPRFVNVRCLARALAHLPGARKVENPLAVHRYSIDDAYTTLSCLALLFLAGVSDYTDSIQNIGPKAAVQTIVRFFPKIKASLVERSHTNRYRLNVNAAYQAYIYLLVAGKKRPPTAKSRRGVTKSRKLSGMTEEDLNDRDIDTLSQALSDATLSDNFDNDLIIAADMHRENPQESLKLMHRARKQVTSLPASVFEIATRFAAVNKVLAAMLENTDGAIVDLPEEHYGYARIDPNRPCNKFNIRHAHVWPESMVDNAFRVGSA